MDKQQCKESILFHLKQIVDILKEYDSNADYIALCYLQDTLMFNTKTWENDENNIKYIGEYYGK
jgi:hypothetical protein